MTSELESSTASGHANLVIPEATLALLQLDGSISDEDGELKSVHQGGDCSYFTPEKLLQMAPDILADVDQAEIFQMEQKRKFPTFHHHEIILGDVLGTGSFGIVREVVAFNLREPSPLGNSGSGEEDVFVEDAGVLRKQIRTSLVSSLVAEGSHHTLRTIETLDSGGLDPFHEGEDDHYQVHEAKKIMKKRCKRDGVHARYAVKCLNVDDLDDDLKIVRGRIDVAIEIKYLQALDHPNIVRMRGVHDSKNPLDPRAFFLMDRLYGTLADKFREWKLARKKGRGNVFLFRRRDDEYLEDLWIERLVVAYDVRSALDYMHAHKMIYRDLKPENIGFDVRGDVKLFDFGLAKSLHPDSVTDHDSSLFHLSAPTGSFPYMAPEVMHVEPYNEKCDVFSFGVLLYELLALSLVKRSKRPRTVYEKISVKCSLPQKQSAWSPRLQNLCKICWNPLPQCRPSMKEIGDKLQDELQAIQHQFSFHERSEQLDEKSVMSLKKSMSILSHRTGIKSHETMEGRFSAR